MSLLNDDAVPIGFGMALAQNLNAMKSYSGMSEAEKEEILNRARDAKSRDEMESLIHSMDPSTGSGNFRSDLFG